MRTAAVVLWAILAVSCSRQAAPVEASRGAESKPKSGEITLDATAQKNAGIEVMEAQLGSVRETISATGELTVNEDRTWSVGAHIEGRVIEVLVKPGDLVAKRAVLAHLHSHEVHDSRADYRKASDEVTRAKAAAAQARTLRDRAARLLELKAGSRQELDLAEAHLREAEASLRNAATELARVETHIVEYLGVPLSSGHDEHSDDVPVRAPESGLLIDRKVSAGAVVAVGQDMFRITDPSTLWMIANVAEADLQYLRVGQPVRVLVRAHPGRPFNGRILRLGEELDPTTRTLKVRVLVPNPGRLLKPEMYASAGIERGASRNALYVPDAAAQEMNGAEIVFVRTAPERFEARPVETGGHINGRVEIVSGLRPGDQVVVKGSFVLKSEMLRHSLEGE